MPLDQITTLTSLTADGRQGSKHKNSLAEHTFEANMPLPSDRKVFTGIEGVIMHFTKSTTAYVLCVRSNRRWLYRRVPSRYGRKSNNTNSWRLDEISLYSFHSVFYTLFDYHFLLPTKWDSGRPFNLCASSVCLILHIPHTAASLTSPWLLWRSTSRVVSLITKQN